MPVVANATVASTVVWEVRTTSTGTGHGAGFNPSNAAGNTTDYSQQDQAQYNAADLASVAGTTNPSVITSASHNFVTADVGNLIHITAGTNWTAGIYEIVSVSGNAATLDRAVGTAVSLSSGTYFVGGAGLFSNSAWSTAFRAQTKAAQTVWFKAGGTFTFAAGFGGTIPLLGSVNTWFYLLGYNATRGDNPTGSNRPLLDVSATPPSVGGSSAYVANLIISGSTIGNSPVLTLAGNDHIQNSKFINKTTTAGQVALGISTRTTVINSEAISYRGTALTTGGTALIMGCYLHDSNIGFQSGGGTTMINSIVASNVTNAIKEASVASVYIGNTVYGGETQIGTGITFSTGLNNGIKAYNNIFSGFVTAMNHTDALNLFLEDFNDIYNSGTARTNVATGTNSVALNPQFSNVAEISGATATTSGSVLTQSGGNFSTVTDNVDFVYIVSGTGVTAGKYLITSHTTTTLTLDIAPGTSAVADKAFRISTGHNFIIGTNLKALAFPAAFPGGLTTSYTDPGAVQRSEGTGTYTNPGIANVRSGTGYTYNGSSLTGTLDLPSISDVRNATTFDGATKTGTLIPTTTSNASVGDAGVVGGHPKFRQ